MINRKRWWLITISVIVVFIIVIATFRERSIRNSRIIPMPEGYEGIYVGMSASDLPDNYDITYDTDLFTHRNPENTFLPKGYYWCTDWFLPFCRTIGSIELAEGGEDIEKLRTRTPGLVQGAIKLWGHDYTVNVTRGGVPVLSWKRKGVSISMTLLGRYKAGTDKEEVVYYNSIIIYPREEEGVGARLLSADVEDMQAVFSNLPDIVNYNGPVLQ